MVVDSFCELYKINVKLYKNPNAVLSLLYYHLEYKYTAGFSRNGGDTEKLQFLSAKGEYYAAGRTFIKELQNRGPGISGARGYIIRCGKGGIRGCHGAFRERKDHPAELHFQVYSL